MGKKVKILIFINYFKKFQAMRKSGLHKWSFYVPLHLFFLGSIPHRSTVSFEKNRIERETHQHFWGAELENKESFILKRCSGID